MQPDPTLTGFCNAYRTISGGVLIDSYVTRMNIMSNPPLFTDITNELVSETNTENSITNSDLEIYPLVLQKAALTSVTPNAVIESPLSRSGNNPTILWSV